MCVNINFSFMIHTYNNNRPAFDWKILKVKEALTEAVNCSSVCLLFYCWKMSLLPLVTTLLQDVTGLLYFALFPFQSTLTQLPWFLLIKSINATIMIPPPYINTGMLHLAWSAVTCLFSPTLPSSKFQIAFFFFLFSIFFFFLNLGLLSFSNMHTVDLVK